MPAFISPGAFEVILICGGSDRHRAEVETYVALIEFLTVDLPDFLIGPAGEFIWLNMPLYQPSVEPSQFSIKIGGQPTPKTPEN